MKSWKWMFVVIAVSIGSAAAEDDIWSKTINNETNARWSVQPDKPKGKKVAADVPGGFALRVKGRKANEPWAVQASSPTGGAINQGDVIMLMFYARAEVLPEGGSTLPARVQLSGEPYTTVLETQPKLTTEWQQFCKQGVASAELPAGKGNVSIHLATADHTVDLGPVFVFNFGPGYDRKKLSGCEG